MDELSELKEFYDPDTVELMNWINSNTPRKAVFAGSMQLLAGVKLCTGRTLTNHPHYEDKSLRERTQAVRPIFACAHMPYTASKGRGQVSHARKRGQSIRAQGCGLLILPFKSWVQAHAPLR